MSESVFLIDTNVLVTPFNQYYSFDLAPSFWTQLNTHVSNGAVKILDLVKNEIDQGRETDELKNWLQELTPFVIDHREQAIIAKYSSVLQYLQNNPLYRPSALAEWSRATVADPWLIATAAVYGYTLITFEAPSGGLSEKSVNRFAKIPDVAREFGVATENLFFMMRSLGIKLS